MALDWFYQRLLPEQQLQGVAENVGGDRDMIRLYTGSSEDNP